MVSSCVEYIDNELDSGATIDYAIRSCSQIHQIAKSNLYRWWKVYQNYGEVHIILNERVRQIRKKYGVARRLMSDRHLQELQRIVDLHPEYYLDEYVLVLPRVTGIFTIHLQSQE